MRFCQICDVLMIGYEGTDITICNECKAKEGEKKFADLSYDEKHLFYIEFGYPKTSDYEYNILRTSYPPVTMREYLELKKRVEARRSK